MDARVRSASTLVMTTSGGAMGRIGLIFTSAAAMLAGSVLGAGAAAAAGTPEWYECVKAKGVGTYEKGCAKEGGKGGYSARPGVGTGSFIIQSKGKVALRVASASRTIVCDHLAIRGQKEMPNRLTGVTLTLTLCARDIGKGNDHCETQEEGGPKEKGIIEGEALAGELGYISRSPLKVGLKLTGESEPGGVAIGRVYCIGPADHRRWSGSFVGELGGFVNVASKKATLAYLPGPYLGEVEPGSTPLVDPPLEGEEAGALVEERPITTGTGWGLPSPAAVEGKTKITGEQMVRA